MLILCYFMTSDLIFYIQNALLRSEYNVTRHFITRHRSSYIVNL
jgi:hypothetical protein